MFVDVGELSFVFFERPIFERIDFDSLSLSPEGENIAVD